MSPLPVLIRILLCASLLLNGIGSAAASARMAMADMRMAAPAAAAAGAPAASSTGDCGHAVADGRSLPAPASPSADGAHDDDECLRSCMELCRHPCQALFGLQATFAGPDIAAEPARRTMPGPRSMYMPPPTRPPIV